MKNFKHLMSFLFTITATAIMAQGGGVVLNAKFIPSDDPYNQHGTLRLESYVTGATVTTEVEEAQACDVVLVLDVSGSMNDDITSYSYTKQSSKGYTYDNLSSSTYYYKDGDEYYKVKKGGTWKGGLFHIIGHYEDCYIYYTKNGATIYLFGTSTSTTKQTVDGENDVIWTGVLYKRTESTQSKIDALKTAVNNFLDQVQANGAKNNIVHNVSIVKFADNSYYKSNHLTEGDHRDGRDNYTELLKNFTKLGKDNATNLTTLKNTINSIIVGGATSADYGMTIAQEVLDQSTYKNDGNSKVVIMFTDGDPNHGSGFSSDVANTTIGKAKTMKDNGAIIFTIGTFINPNDNENTYMNYVSSNYPSATNMTTGGNQKGSTYYNNVSTSTGLDDVFQTIAREVISGGAYNSKVTGTTINKGVLSEYFKLPENISVQNIAIKVAQCTSVTKEGDEVTGYNFSADISGNTNNGITTINTGLGSMSITPQFNKNTKEVWCDGFDYSKYWCGTGDRPVQSALMQKSLAATTETANGYMLIMEFPVEIDDAGLYKMWKNPDNINDGGDRSIYDVPINTEESGLYYASGLPIEHYESLQTSVTSSAELPIELLSFTAECMGNATQLAWSTATETNNEYFTIERSEDAVNYTEIARIQGAGTSAEQHDYSYMTNNSSSRMVYYRLRQTDIDGTTEVFEPIAVQCSVMEEAYISMYPVPAKDMVNIESNVNIENVEIFSMQGSLVKQVMANNTRVQINLNNLQAGVFTLRITTANGETMVKKLIKQ